MAEKKKGMFNKKWVVAVAILAFVAIVVTTVLLLLPKNTRNVVEKVNEQTTAMFLVNDEELKLYESFEKKINGVESSYYTEAENAKMVSYSLNEIVKFYNQYLYYSEDTGVFQDNYGKIIKGIEKAETAQKTMNNILINVRDKVKTGSTNYIRTAWRDFRKVYIDYLNGFQQAFVGLEKVFESSLGSGLTQNSMTYNVLNIANYLIEDIVQSYQEVYNLDINDTATSYTFKGEAKVAKLTNLVSTYIEDETQLVKYNYSSQLQERIKKVDSFETLYKVSIEKVVASISSSGDFDFKAVGADVNGQVLEEVKSLINGGVTV